MKTLPTCKHVNIIVWIIVCMFTYNAQAQSKIQQFDENVLIDLAKTRTPAQTEVAMFLSRNYRIIDVGIPAGLLIGGWATNNKEMRQNSLYVFSSTLISYSVTELIKHIVKRPRPFVRNLKIVAVYDATNSSFPSGHSSSTIGAATALSIAYPKWYVVAPSFLWAGATCYSRMYLGVHYPTDVTAGALLGAGTALSLQFMKKPK
jgi:membrane-associated phospholipid phosphatase